MKIQKRIMYPTMNSWNGEYGLAYNLKIYNVIKKDLQDKAYEVYSDENLSYELYQYIDDLICDFTHDTGYQYTAGFNGRSGGYLVLYKCNRCKDNSGNYTLRTSCAGYDEKDVPTNVKKLFHNLAQDIVDFVEQFLSEHDIDPVPILVEKKIKRFKTKTQTIGA